MKALVRGSVGLTHVCSTWETVAGSNNRLWSYFQWSGRLRTLFRACMGFVVHGTGFWFLYIKKEGLYL